MITERKLSNQLIRKAELKQEMQGEEAEKMKSGTDAVVG